MSHQRNMIEYHQAAERAGLSYQEAETLRRSAMVLHRWSEHECNGVICRAEAGMKDHRGRPMIEGRAYSVTNIDGPGPLRYWLTSDRETPAIKRAAAIAQQHGMSLEVQGDPRGWPLSLKTSDGRTISPPVR